ncbi:MAG TPA: hypothetical protein PKC23_04535 [Candidatus Desulfobacillus sp.]|nr:hypothetical protein [Candidatus Desulfobacillus sp.]
MARAVPDLSDSRLQLAVGATVALTALWFLLRAWLPPAWREPGSPELYLAGVAGFALLLVPMFYSLYKRTGGGSPRSGFNAHVLCSLAGLALIAVHSGGYLRRPPALLLLALLAIVILGVWARLRGSRRMSATFGRKAPGFAAPDPAVRQQLRELIGQKRALLARLAPDADEATFSVNLPHFLRSPRLALRYRRLARQEARLLGVRAAVPPTQAWWRPLHMALGWIFLFGVLVHVVTVTFFAGYVADGGAITWWHLAEW